VTQPFRTQAGGVVIDRAVEIRFTFDGLAYTGHQGDTLASALLANGVRTVGRSLKHRRPRGIHGAGAEEPNALVTVGRGARRTPNLKATEVVLTDGLVASSQRGWPSVRRDLGAVNGFLDPLLPPGFYYKTFMRPRRLWPIVEQVLRRAAASAGPASEADPDRYEKRRLHTDVLVVGAGPAGLAAAAAAAEAGRRVILAESAPRAGGCLLDYDISVAGSPAVHWVEAQTGLLNRSPDATLLTRCTVFGYYAGGRFGAVQETPEGPGTQRYLQIQASRAVLATGAIERPLLFSGNDRPGVMLASAAQRYVHRYGVRPGTRAVVLTNNDSAAATAHTLRAGGVEVAAVIDTRDGALALPQADLRAATDVAAYGRGHVEGLRVSAEGRDHRIDCDLVCVSGGWTPTVHLHAGLGGTTVFSPTWGAFVPDRTRADTAASVGACGGVVGVGAAIADGRAAGDTAAADDAAGDTTAAGDRPSVAPELGGVDPGPGHVAASRGHVFVDQSTDVDVADIATAVTEGYDGPQHVKRYTTLGMGPDQGKTANINAAAVVAELTGASLADVGTTTYRPPYVPVALGALAARESGARIAPVRRTPIDDWHAAAGAVFMPSGLWRRPQYYRSNGDDAVTAAVVEARRVRTSVGMADVSTLGKIELTGPGVGELLDFVYTNRFSTLPVGRVRYGVMLRDDGYVMDDGTTSRLSDDHWLLTTTTANAESVLQHLEYCHQVLRPELDVSMHSVTDQWAVAAVAGPNSRAVVGAFFDGGLDVRTDALPFMGVASADLGGIPVRIARVSFAGELGYEIGVPADYGTAMWERLQLVGAPYGIGPYGLEAMDYLRIEKGHLVVGMDIDGRVSPLDLGLDALCSTEKDFVGRRSLEMPVFSDADRPQLAGFVAQRSAMITAGAQLVEQAFDGTPQQSHGRITSVAFSPTLGRPIALGLLVRGRDRIGEQLHAVSPVTGDQVAVDVASPHFYDPGGERQRS